MQFPILRPRSLFRRRTVGDDAMAGLVLGVESVPDGLASGLLAGVNPVAGLYAYMYGLAGGALFSSTSLMAVQGTGAMAIIVADVDLGAYEDPERALFTLSMLTGVVMVLAGVAHLGTILRFVSNSVMTGFITTVGLNIIMGQLDNLTGYVGQGSNRVARAADLVLNLGEVQLATVAVGAATIAMIVVLQRTRIGSLGLVVAVVLGSVLAAVLRSFDHEVLLVGDLVDVPAGLPTPTVPVLRDVFSLLVPAASLAFVGLVQGAGVSAGFPNEDGSPQDQSQDFVAQGAGNIAAGVFQGMPVGGSMSASSLAATAGARSRTALLIAAVVMGVVVIALGGVIEHVAMPSLAGLLIVVGVGTIRPASILSVAKTGTVPFVVMGITFVLTLLIPLQYAVLVGVGISIILFVIRESTQLVTRRLVFHDDGGIEETDPPDEVPAGDVIVLQPYGALFFATATTLLEQLPTVTSDSHDAVVILRIRGADEAGATILAVVRDYAAECADVGSKLVVVTDNTRVIRQLRLSGITEVIDPEDIYRSTAFLGTTVRRAHDDATQWVAQRLESDGDGKDRTP